MLSRDRLLFIFCFPEICAAAPDAGIAELDSEMGSERHLLRCPDGVHPQLCTRPSRQTHRGALRCQPINRRSSNPSISPFISCTAALRRSVAVMCRHTCFSSVWRGVCFLCGYGICMNGSACVGGGMRVIHALGVRCRTSRRMRRPHARPEPRPGGRARHIWCNRTNARFAVCECDRGNGTGEASGEHAEKPGEGARPDGR